MGNSDTDMSIDHEAAKKLAESMVRTHTNRNDVPATVLSVHISEAYIDLHEQLTAERTRVDALAELVKNGSKMFYAEQRKEAERIMEGRA